MKKTVIKEVEKIIKDYDLNCSVLEFADRVDWDWISKCQTVSEDFIREFADRVNWCWISRCQKLSEGFIREFADRVNWDWISKCQNLSEDFIREFADRVDWDWISGYQSLSEGFIREFADRVNWYWISKCQKLSESFIKEFKDKINIGVYNAVHEEKGLTQKRKEVKAYADKYGLQYDKDYLYAYREHDNRGCGMVMPTVYKKGVYYRDWHCDMRRDEANSFGFGIWPKGNTPIRVKISDWGVEVDREDGKGRVWGFEII